MKTEIICQILGGGFYLLNKIFLSLGERKGEKKFWKLNMKAWSWISFLIGIPFWLYLFLIDKNYIALGLESSAIPSLILGLIISIKGLKTKEPLWIKYFVIFSVIFGLYFSIDHYHGLNNLTQISEIVMVSTFLIGTYYLAKQRNIGYLYYILMHIACIYLMYLNEYKGLMLQQLISIGFVIDAYIISKNTNVVNIIKRKQKRSYHAKICRLENLDKELKELINDNSFFFSGFFEAIIWWNRPCMGEEGPNPGNGNFEFFKEETFKKEISKISINVFSKEEFNKKDSKEELFILEFSPKDYTIKLETQSIKLQNSNFIISLGFENNHSNKGVFFCKKN